MDEVLCPPLAGPGDRQSQCERHTAGRNRHHDANSLRKSGRCAFLSHAAVLRLKNALTRARMRFQNIRRMVPMRGGRNRLIFFFFFLFHFGFLTADAVSAGAVQLPSPWGSQDAKRVHDLRAELSESPVPKTQGMRRGRDCRQTRARARSPMLLASRLGFGFRVLALVKVGLLPPRCPRLADSYREILRTAVAA